MRSSGKPFSGKPMSYLFVILSTFREIVATNFNSLVSILKLIRDKDKVIWGHF